jgi:hypothetical protein
MTADEPPPDDSTPQRVAPSETMAWQTVEGRVVRLDLDSEHYYRLDPVGSRMWELLCECNDRDSSRTPAR